MLMLSKGPEIAFKKGYRVSGNRILSPRGKTIKLKKNDVYPKFNIWHNGKTLTIKCHQLTAFQKYGKKVYGEQIVVRHVFDDFKDFSLENIELGLHEDNVADRYMNSFLQHWIEEVNNEAREMLESEVPF